MFSVMWSELLMISAISCPLWSSVYQCQRVEGAFTSPLRTECGMSVMCCMQCPCQLFCSVLMFCVVCINGRRYVCCSECYVVSNERVEPTPFLVRTVVKLCTLEFFFL